MKDKMKEFFKFEGRLNRIQYLKAQIWILFLCLLYFGISFKPIDLITSKENAADLSNFLLVLLIITPHLALITYALAVNETKRLRDLMDKDIAVFSIYPLIQFVPILGTIFFMAIFLLPGGKLKGSKFFEDLETIAKKIFK